MKSDHDQGEQSGGGARSTFRVAYADPPYIGCAHLYRAKNPNAAEVDHAALLAQLERDFPDGWALSCHTPSLRVLLPMCPDGVRVAAWVKPFAVFKPGVRVAYAWEPVIFRGGRRGDRMDATVRDWVTANITLQRGVPGAKPRAFAFWLFDVFGLRPGDEFVDLFPGTAGMTEAWREWCARATGERTQLELRFTVAKGGGENSALDSREGVAGSWGAAK